MSVFSGRSQLRRLRGKQWSTAAPAAGLLIKTEGSRRFSGAFSERQ